MSCWGLISLDTQHALFSVPEGKWAGVPQDQDMATPIMAGKRSVARRFLDLHPTTRAVHTSSWNWIWLICRRFLGGWIIAELEEDPAINHSSLEYKPGHIAPPLQTRSPHAII
ncbi:hypothetical protein PoB_005634800 [Plakobranchus ocellatus]|uniref:Uncharacterized protein n=1 Tax=Plakobranchus ocellatus TaxID=259542 RepID=A0AAV4CD75_9GAST|nr:hypothetical protein PoB_005634800 [Plakobranchus ocellatus]